MRWDEEVCLFVEMFCYFTIDLHPTLHHHGDGGRPGDHSGDVYKWVGVWLWSGEQGGGGLP